MTRQEVAFDYDEDFGTSGVIPTIRAVVLTSFYRAILSPPWDVVSLADL
jgi:hypothetical protein